MSQHFAVTLDESINLTKWINSDNVWGFSKKKKKSVILELTKKLCYFEIRTSFLIPWCATCKMICIKVPSVSPFSLNFDESAEKKMLERIYENYKK